MIENIQKEKNALDKNKGCGIVLLLIVFSLWVVIFSAADLFIGWTIEQSLFESSIGITDFRWLAHAICSVMIFLPCLILFLTVKAPRVKMIFRLWMFAAILAILTIPMKTLYLTNQTQMMIIQISAMLLMLICFLVFKKKIEINSNQKTPKSKLVGLALLLGLGISTPWILWGALGSILDTLLALADGVVFGLLVINVIFPYYLEKTQLPERELKISDFILDGFVIMVFLLILVASLAHNGSQQLLAVTVPISGWVIAAFSMAGIGKHDHGRTAAGIISGLLLALPLMFFDMDELSLVISGSEGEILTWASRASWFTFMSLLMIAIVIMINFKVVENLALPWKFDLGVKVFSVVCCIIVYFVWGQTGFYGDNIFIILKDQPNLSDINNLSTYGEKRASIYENMVETANTTQSEIRDKLEKYHLSYTPYYLVNAIEVQGGAIAKLILQKDPTIDRILDSPQLRPLRKTPVLAEGSITEKPEGTLWNLQMIQSDKVNKELNITGNGIVIGQTDSGVDGRHVELSDQYRGYNASDDYNWFDPWNNSPFPVDLSGHGTQTLGVMLGKNTGVAPNAQWIGCVNLARNLGNPAKYLDCMQFMLAPFPQGGDPFTDGMPEKGANIVNNSWGCPDVEGCDTEVYESAVSALKKAGIFMVSAAGNTGYYGCATVTDPIAIYEDVLTVGSVNVDGQISSFSSLGPVLVDGSNRSKPDLLAPGENVLSSYPGGAYSEASGTSFSAPHVSGVVALLWSANPDLIGNIDETTKILLESTQPYKGSDPGCGEISYGSGAGIIDAYKAVKLAIQYKK